MRLMQRWPGEEGHYVRWFCPGCESSHAVAFRPYTQDNGESWEWNMDTERPTLSPSVNGRGCHCFIEDGKIRFLDDCTHALAGQTVAMVDMDDPKEPL